ncbi:hypothetical protein L6452_21013 [Arctium lappa]|uniref:Uncharacterized protein n=1 Tax=Arctium lappa TaxID=4217 RepID=A0ACB9BDF7_ARCLA|nr:hypothetical protein L6452_21013 [Arctium lappa]
MCDLIFKVFRQELSVVNLRNQCQSFSMSASPSPFRSTTTYSPSPPSTLTEHINSLPPHSTVASSSPSFEHSSLSSPFSSDL